MVQLKLYNTLTKQLEEFKPLADKQVSFYHCGPTVYWTQHIGNLRGMTMGDLVVRTLRYFGYLVKHVRNYTDVGHLTSDADSGEDKMEKGARREGLSPQQIAQKYIDIFERDISQINLLEPSFKPRATEYVPEMIKLTRELLAKGFAYTTDLAVYFKVSQFPNYSALSGQKIEQLIAGAGKAETSDPQKQSPLDFALWFFKAGAHQHALQSWPSPFVSPLVQHGEGFPGWHIECSAMTRALLGKTIDLHMGGIEHVPVHHTNEIAQSEAANGVRFANYWLHNEHLLVNNQKMAKSEGTGFSLQEVIGKGFAPLALRYFFLTAHYRSKQNFTWEALQNAQNSLQELYRQVGEYAQINTHQTGNAKQQATFEELKDKFAAALANDLNIPQALAITWETLKANLTPEQKLNLLATFDEVLGLQLIQSAPIFYEITSLPDKVRNLAVLREQARKTGNFPEADRLRQEIEKLGFIIQDTEAGPRFNKKF